MKAYETLYMLLEWHLNLICMNTFYHSVPFCENVGGSNTYSFAISEEFDKYTENRIRRGNLAGKIVRNTL